jgi:glycosyltransferase involved in cell wall biosynthesis
MCQWDADLQFPPEDIPAVLAPIGAGDADLSIGSRFMQGSDRSQYKFSFFRVVGNWIVNAWVSLMCGRRMTDVTTGCKAWSRAAIARINFQDKRFVYEVEIVARAARLGLRITQVPVHYHNRQGGVSGHGSGWREFKSIVTCGAKLLLCATRIRMGGGAHGTCD